ELQNPETVSDRKHGERDRPDPGNGPEVRHGAIGTGTGRIGWARPAAQMAPARRIPPRRRLTARERSPPMPDGRSADPRSAAGSVLGHCLARLRKQRGLTLRELSRRTGIPASTLSKVQNHQATLSY